MHNPHLVDTRSGQRVPPTVEVGTQKLELNRNELVAGAQAGIGAGVAMGLVAIIVSISYGFGLWTPFKDVAGVLLPQLAASGAEFSLLAVVVGTGLHFVMAALLGVAFAALYAGMFKLTFRVGMPIVVGVLFGLVTWFLVRYLVLPLSGTDVYGVPAFLTAHAVFGAVLGGLYPYMPARR
jgi:hypothetical protein